MRLCLVNPSNPLVSVVNVRQSRWNRYRVWTPLRLMVLAGLTPPEDEVVIVDENLEAPDRTTSWTRSSPGRPRVSGPGCSRTHAAAS